jgi:hypothetical protein
LFSCGEYLIHDRIEVAFFKEIGILVFLFQRQCAGNDPPADMLINRTTRRGVRPVGRKGAPTPLPGLL